MATKPTEQYNSVSRMLAFARITCMHAYLRTLVFTFRHTLGRRECCVMVSTNNCSLNVKRSYALYVQAARGATVGSGTGLHAGRLRVRFQMVSLEFFIDIILPAAVWLWG
jgi:hypothetical protein